MLILGIESSCDETAAAVIDREGQVRSDVVHSQITVHGPYGGVVPELAARNHVKNIIPVVDQALRTAGTKVEELEAIAVTVQPGLAGALIVGAQFARTLAWSRHKPLIGVDHLVGHLLAIFLRPSPAPPPPFPFLGLLVSGGHTALYRVEGPLASQIYELGATRDDAAGEAFDKAAKLLGLGYPGGPEVDRRAAHGNPRAHEIPLPMMEGQEFSFSGVKSWLARHVARSGIPDEAGLDDLCASFQRAVVEVLARKLVRTARAEGLRHLVVCGGVAANQGLRRRTAELAARHGLVLHVPPPSRCTDNGAMIAYAGLQRFLAGETDPLSISTSTRTSLPRVTRKGRGSR
ncbi:MAG: tRNA (adenosine(37)-N6)-threonylcarbamoyltransferase complex transferase subunit TsaD [Myxococcales bacterium]|nr:tRNA (adenosine(37)-N6)-threonylcarbamoyltransferase complex transferase subunit TsaD [Polyangiaceae bacterium]MDW8249895.1 tRNA (adenosine(37)-N6)-threonylcarbamoyltransferase complex transferase subunit TsaD [Myxococcales bacterium]